jgi:heme A synthase
LILVQATLGAFTVLKYKPADIATLHVVCGALALGTGVMGALISRNKVLPSLLGTSVSKTEHSMEAAA